MPYYGVQVGKVPGVYNSWTDCEVQIKTVSGAVFKKFDTYDQAHKFMLRTDGYGHGNKQGRSKSSISSEHLNVLVKEEEPKPRKRGRPVKNSNEADNPGSFENIFVEPPSKKKGSILPQKEGKSVSIYVDGCCTNNGRKGARAGIGVYFGPGSEHNIGERLSGRPTNNRAEIHAAIAAINKAKFLEYNQVHLLTDSKFMINGISTWMKKWVKNGWKTGAGQPVKNKDDFVELDIAMRGVQVTMEHVKGHSGVLGNEEADRLANEGAAKDG